MKQLKELDKQVKAMQKRLENYGKYEGMILNKNYHDLMKEIETIKYNIDNDVDVKPQTITGLIKRVKNVKKTKVIDMFDIYVPQLDNPKSVREALNIKFSFDWKIEELPRIFKEKATHTIERLRRIYKPKPTEQFEPEPEPESTEEVKFSDAVLKRILDNLYKYDWGLFVELRSQIHKLIDDLGYETVAKVFEKNAQDYATSGDMKYDETKGLYEDMGMWDFMDIDTNKDVTSRLDYYEVP